MRVRDWLRVVWERVRPERDQDTEGVPLGVGVGDAEPLALRLWEQLQVEVAENVGVMVGGEGLGLGVAEVLGVRDGVPEAERVW